MTHFSGYECSLCGARYAPGDVTYTCPEDDGILDVRLAYDAIRREVGPADVARSAERSLWRYAPLLPVPAPPGRSGPLASVGCTPLYPAPRAAARLGLRHLWLKDDGRLPTGSLKDRASSIVTARALDQGIERIITASTGNAGVAQAAMSNAAGIPGVVVVPAAAPPAKIAQLMVFGAQLLLVEGNYDAAFDLAVAASRELGWYCRNTGMNPFTAEGKKTVAFEICEQLSAQLAATDAGDPDGFGRSDGPERWTAPDRIFVSVGDGNIISGLHKGLKDLHALGWIEKMPKLCGVQSEGSAAIANAFRDGTETITPVSADTVADSIAADRPADGLRALRAATRTGGAIITVTDQQILDAIVALGRDATIFAEPAASAAYAGLCQEAAAGAIDPDERVVVLITGNGLKDVAAAARVTAQPPRIEPTVAALRGALAAS
jgi:threonine synthase